MCFYRGMQGRSDRPIVEQTRLDFPLHSICRSIRVVMSLVVLDYSENHAESIALLALHSPRLWLYSSDCFIPIIWSTEISLVWFDLVLTDIFGYHRKLYVQKVAISFIERITAFIIPKFEVNTLNREVKLLAKIKNYPKAHVSTVFLSNST